LLVGYDANRLNFMDRSFSAHKLNILPASVVN